MQALQVHLIYSEYVSKHLQFRKVFRLLSNAISFSFVHSKCFIRMIVPLKFISTFFVDFLQLSRLILQLTIDTVREATRGLCRYGRNSSLSFEILRKAFLFLFLWLSSMVIFALDNDWINFLSLMIWKSIKSTAGDHQIHRIRQRG